MAFGKGMVSSDAMNQHREMAGAKSKGNFGVSGLPQRNAMHPDATAHTGRKPEMADSMRGPALGGKGLGMQAAGDHGPTPASHFKYEGKA